MGYKKFISEISKQLGLITYNNALQCAVIVGTGPYIAQAGLELMILLLSLPTAGITGHEPLYQAFLKDINHHINALTYE